MNISEANDSGKYAKPGVAELSAESISASQAGSTGGSQDHPAIPQLPKPTAVAAIISNACLLVWAILLMVIGMQAVSGNASTVIWEIANKLVPGRTSDTSSPAPSAPLNGSDELSQYIDKNYPEKDELSIPPIGIVLDRLQISANWSDPNAIDQANGNEKAPDRADYNSLFDIVAGRLKAIADFSPAVSVGSKLTIDNDIMPLRFRGQNFKEQPIDLPVEAVLWAKARQDASAAKTSRIDFLDLFVLLVILGGFGSWIYLVRRHIDPKITPKLDEYFYRPVLGMALAIAVFIVNITLHSFVSTASINDVRRETLILLAFTAGLLSDKTYEFIEKVTGEKIGRQQADEPPANLQKTSTLSTEKVEQPNSGNHKPG